jgi:hypothetical protein
MNNPRLVETEAPMQPFPVPPSAGNLITLIDRCWVCDEVFHKYSGRNHGLVQEFHHPIPRAVGGTDGPTVSLCSGHHAIVHAVANRLLSKKPWDDLLHTNSGSLSIEINGRIMRLAGLLVNSTSALRNDPNRRVNVGTSLSNVDNYRLKSVAAAKKLSVSRYLNQIVLEALNRESPIRRSMKG